MLVVSGLLPRVLLSPKEDIFVFIFGFRRGARWRCALFFSVPRWTCVPCPVSRVPRVPVCFVFLPALGVGLVCCWWYAGRAVPCLISYRAAPRPVCCVSPCYLFFLFCGSFFSCFVSPFFSLFLSFSPFCFDSQPQTPGGSVPSTIFYVGGNQNKLKSYKGTACERTSRSSPVSRSLIAFFLFSWLFAFNKIKREVLK